MWRLVSQTNATCPHSPMAARKNCGGSAARVSRTGGVHCCPAGLYRVQYLRDPSLRGPADDRVSAPVHFDFNRGTHQRGREQAGGVARQRDVGGQGERLTPLAVRLAPTPDQVGTAPPGEQRAPPRIQADGESAGAETVRLKYRRTPGAGRRHPGREVRPDREQVAVNRTVDRDRGASGAERHPNRWLPGPVSCRGVPHAPARLRRTAHTPSYLPLTTDMPTSRTRPASSIPTRMLE